MPVSDFTPIKPYARYITHVFLEYWSTKLKSNNFTEFLTTNKWQIVL